MKRNTLKLLSLLAILTLLSVWAFGQAETGQITGTIRDASGAVVSGAKVSVKSLSTGLARDTASNSSGIFTISSLPPAPYEVTIEASGFQKIAQQVTVTIGALTDVRSEERRVGKECRS